MRELRNLKNVQLSIQLFTILETQAMRNRALSVTLVALSLCIPASLYAADAPDKPATDKPAAEKPAQPGGGGGGGGGRRAPGGGGGGFGGGGGGGFGGPGGFGGGFGGGNPAAMLNVARDPLDELVMIIGDLNMKPDFTLTADQKTKIQAARDALKKLRDKWQADHEADFNQFAEQMNDLRNSNNPQEMREKMQEITVARMEVMESMPKSDETVAEIKGILTTEQLKMLDSRLAERKAEQQKAREQLMERMRNGGPGAGGGFGGGNGGGQGGPGGGGPGGGGRGGRGGRGGGGGGGGGNPGGI